MDYVLINKLKAILEELELNKQVGVLDLVFSSSTKRMVQHKVIVGCTFFEAKESVRWSMIAEGRYELPFKDKGSYAHRQPIFKNLYLHKIKNAEFLHGFLIGAPVAKYIDLDVRLLMGVSLVETIDFSSGLTGVDRSNNQFYELIKKVCYDFF